jgi:hypothetical protein
MPPRRACRQSVHERTAGSRANEQLRTCRVSFDAGVVERRGTLAVRRVDERAGVQQHAYGRFATRATGNVQRPPLRAFVVHAVWIGALAQQRFGCCGVAPRDCAVQSGAGCVAHFSRCAGMTSAANRAGDSEQSPTGEGRRASQPSALQR